MCETSHHFDIDISVSMQVKIWLLDMRVGQLKASLEVERAKAMQAAPAAQRDPTDAGNLLQASRAACKKMQSDVLFAEETLRPLREKLQQVLQELKGMQELRELGHQVQCISSAFT